MPRTRAAIFRTGAMALALAGAILLPGLLSGCADAGLPGLHFQGGPNPWLPAGAPQGPYAAPGPGTAAPPQQTAGSAASAPGAQPLPREARARGAA